MLDPRLVTEGQAIVMVFDTVPPAWAARTILFP